MHCKKWKNAAFYLVEMHHLTLLRVPKNNPIKGFLGSILTPTWVLGSFPTSADALKSLDVWRNTFNVYAFFSWRKAFKFVRRFSSFMPPLDHWMINGHPLRRQFLLVHLPMPPIITVCHKIIFHDLNENNSTNIADIPKNPFD